MYKLIFTLIFVPFGLFYYSGGKMTIPEDNESEDSKKSLINSTDNSIAKVDNIRFEIIYQQTTTCFKIVRRELGVEDSVDELFKCLSRTGAQNYFLELVKTLSFTGLYKQVIENNTYGSTYSCVLFEVLPLTDLKDKGKDD